ncbi:MAG: phosphate acyltransferase PlsX [Planctomycetota bacterium]
MTLEPSQRLALDVPGGDRAPEATLDGALRAVEGGLAAERILLVGDESAIRAGLAERGGDPGFALLHAPDAIPMGASPAQALRAQPRASIPVMVGAIAAGQAGAAVSMGNTGAVVGAATLGLGTLEGVRRAGIAVTVALTGQPVVFLDMGANVVPRPEHLVQYGAMGSIYMRDVLGVEEPRVGLLNVGEEKGKGTPLLKEAYEAMETAGYRFVGNIEGGGLFGGSADVVVMDGFTGNVILKLMEHFSDLVLGLVFKELRAHDAASWGGEALSSIKQSIDYSSYGGALLLGVRGVVIIGHGRSDAVAVANALGQAALALDSRVNQHIEQGLART